MNLLRRPRTWYWLLTLVLFTAQAVYTWAGLERLWYEELAESIRNPFWLDHRLVYDGTSTNVAWYGLVLLADKAFGFSPYAAKYLRLALHVPFLLCSALLLERWLGVRRAWMPLVACGLSPTLLYFNNLGTSYGLDVELLPVFVWPILQLTDRRERSGRRSRVLSFVLAAFSMAACLTYPSFLLCLPILLTFYLVAARPTVPIRKLAGDLAWMAAGFLTPFLVALLYLRDVRSFLADPVNGTGVFRAGGRDLTFETSDVARGLLQVMQDLFVRGSSYYFAVPHVEFSGRLGLLAAWAIVVGTIVAAWKWKPARLPLVLAGCLCLLAVVAPSLSRNVPGLRRSTGIIAAVYVAIACVWAIGNVEDMLGRALAWVGRIGCGLLVLHHVMVYGSNLRYLRDETTRMNDPWFNRFGEPDQSIRAWARDWVLQNKPLDCGQARPCRYSEIYPAIAAHLESNGYHGLPVFAIDPSSGRTLQLDVELWETRALPH